MHHSLHSSPICLNEFVSFKFEGFDNFRIIELDCRLMRTKDDFFREFGTKFGFPNYFAYNLDSFDECAQDVFLDDSNCYVVRWLNSALLLENADRAEKKAILDTLDDMLFSWNSVQDKDEIFEQKAVPLRFVFE